MTTLMNYVRGEYRADMFRLADPDPSPTRGYRTVRICDCVSREGFLAMSQRAGVTDTRWLPILLFLECALQAGVHLHGAAADRLVTKGIGPIGLTAGEVIDSARQLLNEWIVENFAYRAP